MYIDLVDRLRSREGALTLSVGLDVFWQLPTEILAPFISIISGFVAVPIFITLSTWLMFGVAVYSMAHLAYPKEDAFPDVVKEFRVIFAGGSVLFGYFLQNYSNITELLMPIFTIGPLMVVVMLFYLNYSLDWSLSDPDGELAQMLYQIFPSTEAKKEIRESLEVNGIDGYLFGSFSVLAAGMLLVLPCFIAGMVIKILFNTYPIPDIIFIIYALIGFIDTQTSENQFSVEIDSERLDIEESLFDTISDSIKGIIGVFMTLYCMLGLMMFALWTGLAIRFVREFASLAVKAGGPLVTGFVDNGFQVINWESWWKLGMLTWNNSGVSVLFGGITLFGFWIWLRELRRMPHYLALKRGQKSPEQNLRSRPLGFVLPALLGMVVLTGYLSGLDGTGGISQQTFVILWPLTALTLVGSAYWARICDPQNVNHEFGVIVGGLWLLLVGYLMVANPSIVGTIFTGQIPQFDSIFIELIVSLVVPVSSALVIVFDRSKTNERWEKGLNVGVIISGIVCFFLITISPNKFKFALVLLAPILTFGGILSSYGSWRKK